MRFHLRVAVCFLLLFVPIEPTAAGPAGSAVLPNPGSIGEVAVGTVRALARVERDDTALDLRILVLGEGAPLPARVRLADGQRHGLVVRRGESRLLLSAERRGPAIHLSLQPQGANVAPLAQR